MIRHSFHHQFYFSVEIWSPPEWQSNEKNALCRFIEKEAPILKRTWYSIWLYIHLFERCVYVYLSFFCFSSCPFLSVHFVVVFVSIFLSLHSFDPRFTLLAATSCIFIKVNVDSRWWMTLTRQTKVNTYTPRRIQQASGQI